MEFINIYDKISRKKQGSKAFKKQLVNQNNFYNNIKFNTHSTYIMFEYHKNNIIKELEYLISISD